MRVGRRTINLSNTDKPLWPEDGITKGDLIEYYEAIAPVMLPELRDRLVTMERFPDGIAAERVMQKTKPKYFPEWIKSKSVPKKGGGRVDHVVCNDAATLVYLANQACITVHMGLSCVGRLHQPDQIIFDLDPSTEDFEKVRRAALDMRGFIEDLGLVPFVKTSGSRGLHLTVPLRPSSTYDEVRPFARDVCRAFAAMDPDNLTMEHRKDKRGDRVFLDWMRNAAGQTAVAPFSVRPRPGAPVAMPIEWDEVENRRFRPTGYSMNAALAAVDEGHDPWAGWRRRARAIGEPRRRLERELAG